MPLLLTLGSALLLGMDFSPRMRGFMEGATVHSVVVLPFTACCDPALTSRAERFAVSLTDTLARIPGHRPLDPARVLATWHDARPDRQDGSMEPERFAARLGARRYVTGSLLAVGADEVRVELSLREVGGDGPLYTRRGTTALSEVGVLLQALGSGLAEYLRGESAGIGLRPTADVDS